MKNLKTYESLYGEISRLNPKRYKNDKKAYNLFSEIVEDFKKYDNDLKKIVIRSNGKKLKFGESIDIGDSGELIYLFGKFDYITNNPHTGNKEDGYHSIEISYVPFSLILKKNSLEKAFNVKRINPLKITLTETKYIKNPEYNPNISRNLGFHQEPTNSDRKKMIRLIEKENKFKISPDIAGKLLKYFLKEYNIQYSILKTSKYKGVNSISDIEKGVNPIIKYISVRNKDNDELTLGIRYGEDESKFRKLLYNMSKEEYDLFYKKRNKEIYSNYYKEVEKKKIYYTDKIKNLFKNINAYSYNVYGDFTHYINISFTIGILCDKIKLEEIIKDIINSNNIFEPFNKKSIHVSEYNENCYADIRLRV
jgi:hypothetical protein